MRTFVRISFCLEKLSPVAVSNSFARCYDFPPIKRATCSVSRVCRVGRQGSYALHQTWGTWKHIRGVRDLSIHLHLRFLTPQANRRNPLGCAIAITALDILFDERLSERAEDLGEKFRSGIRAFNSPLVKVIRGRGLLNAVVIDESKSKRGRTAWQFCLLLKSRGVLAKPTHVNVYGCLRLSLSRITLTWFICIESGLPLPWS